MKRPYSALLPCVLVLGVACDKGSGSTTDPDGPGGDTAQTEGAEDSAPKKSDGLDRLLADMDPAADPCQDFYRYACGGWMDRTTLPADKARYSRSFTGIQERNQEIVKRLLEARASAPGEDPKDVMLGDFFAACMDTSAVEKVGKKPLEPLLSEIEGISDKKELMAQLGKLHSTVFGRVGWLGGTGKPPFFRVHTEPDAIDAPDTEIGVFTQSGLGLPSRSMYLGKDERSKALLTAYEQHIARMLQIAGDPEPAAAKRAKAILKLETALAKASKEPADMREFEKNYNKEGVPPKYGREHLSRTDNAVRQRSGREDERCQEKERDCPGKD